MDIWYLEDRANEGDHLKNIIYFHNKELELFSIKIDHKRASLARLNYFETSYLFGDACRFDVVWGPLYTT